MNPYMQFMNSFPHQGNQMQNHSYPHPSYEAIPPQLRGYPEGYQYHPFYHPGMNGFAYPSQYYGCCNHNFFPSYCPPPSMPYGHHHPTHCCGGYSVPPGAQHPCHFPPLLPTMGPTQFEYQKDNPKYQHSFDCPNTQTGGNSFKIEEMATEPRGDTSAVVPSNFENSPYPFVLVPPNYIKDNSGRKANESTCDRQEGSLNSEQLKSAENQPLFLNGWLPVDIDRWKSSEQVDDSGRKIHKDNESPQDVSSNFPVPIFYVPYKANDLGTMERKNAGQQCSQGASVEQMADNPSSPIHMDSLKDKSNERIIVSKDPRIMENIEGKKNAKTTEAASGTSSKHVSSEARKTSGDGKKKLSSPTKSSKLPPVCLRVDPLPKKKKDCSPSKPSSPHNEKDKSGHSFKEDTKSKASSSPGGAKISPDDILVKNKPEEQGTSNEQPKRKVKTIKVYDAESQSGEDVLVSNINCRNENEGRSPHVEDQPNHTQAEKNEAGKFNSSISRELSEDEAAKIIQSAYRGYEERKWQPLKNLKNIKAVQDEVTRLKKQIEALECAQDNSLLDKTRTIIGETIMNLLLKLDSIQGLPPNVRQVRKSVARELVSLQEQLDALGQTQAEKTILPASLAKSEEEVQTADGACIQDDQGKNQLVLEGGNEIDEKDKNKNREEPPLVELSMDEENEVQKKDVPDVVDRYAIQLNDILQNGSETLKDESPKEDVSSNTGDLVSELMSQSVHNLESESLPVRLPEDKVNCIPNMGPAELQEQVPLEPEEKENGDDYGLPEQTPGISKMTNLIEVGDGNKPETVDEASGDDTSDLNKASVNVEPVSEVPVTEHVQDFEKADDTMPKSLTETTTPESTTRVQDFPVTNNEKADDPVPESLTESTTQVRKGCEGGQDVEENSGRLLEKNESIEPDETTPCVRCEEPVIVVDEDYNAPADLTTLPCEQKQADDSLEMFGHPCEPAVTSDIKETDEGKFSRISSSQSGFADTDRCLIEENEKLREQLQKIIEAGQEQLSAISSLSRKVKDLERKLHRKKKVKMCRSRAAGSRSSFSKMSMDDELPFALAS